MQRPTVADFLASRGPGLLGICSTDVAGACAIINGSTQRLIYTPETGDEGWIGSFAEIAFTLSQTAPNFTAPREVARVIGLDVCTCPVNVQNQFYEYLTFGYGHQPKSACATGRCAQLQAYDRGNVPTYNDLVPGNKKLRVYLTDNGDAGKRVLLQGKDQNGVPIRTLDGTVQVDGEFVILSAPFVDSVNEFTTISGILKDITLGRVTIYEYNTLTTDTRLLSFMEPGEKSASLRRYFVNGLPKSCCDGTGTTVQVTAMVKLDYVPVSVVTDYLILPNVEALIEEGQSMRYDSIDDPGSKQMASYHHRNAIRRLQGQVIHTQGKIQPAISFSPFGTARLSKQRIGSLI